MPSFRRCAALAALALVSASNAAQAQLETLWEDRFDDGVMDFGFIVAADAESVFVVAQSVDDAGNNDIVTMRYSPSGDRLWTERYSDGDTYAWSIAIDPDGHAVVLAESIVPATGTDILLLEYDQDGTLLWTTRYDGGGALSDRPGYVSLVIDPADGAAYCTGAAVTPDALQKSCVLKFDTNGALLWERFHDEVTYYESGWAIDLDAAGNVYTTGTATAWTGTEYVSDFVTLKYDAAGNEQWVRTTSPGDRYESAWWLDVRGDRVVVTGEDHSAFGMLGDALTVAYDLDGNEIWTHTYDGAAGANDYATFVALDADGNTYVIGSEGGPWSNSYYLVQKIDPAGVVMWTRNESLWSDLAVAWGGAIDSAGNVYATGYAWGGWESGYDAATVQYAPDGTPLAQHVYDGHVHGNDAASWMALGPNDEVYVTYWSAGPTGLDAVTAELGPRAPGDVTGDGVVDVADLLAVLSAWGACSGCEADLDGDGSVGVSDLLEVLGNWSE